MTENEQVEYDFYVRYLEAAEGIPEWTAPGFHLAAGRYPDGSIDKVDRRVNREEFSRAEFLRLFLKHLPGRCPEDLDSFREGKYRNPLLEPARYARALKLFDGMDGDEVAKLWDCHLRRTGGWSRFDGIGTLIYEEDAMLEFSMCFDEVAYPRRLGALAYEIAKDKAAQAPMVTVDAISPRYATAVNFLYRLQQVEGEGNIVLGCRALGEILGCHFVHASHILRRLVRDGFLERRSPGKFGSEVAEYRFVGKVKHGLILIPGNRERVATVQ